MSEAIPFPRRQPQREIFGEFNASSIDREPPPREWIVDGLVMRGTVCLLTGAPGVGKSRLLQQLGTAAALGQPWLGREVVRAPCFAFFLEDDQAELERRQQQINTYHNVLPPDLDGCFTWNTRTGQSTKLVEFERWSDKPIWTQLWQDTWNHVRHEEAKLVIFDSATAVFGGNANFGSQVQAFLRECHQRAIEINGAIIIATHPSRSDPNSYGGSGQWEAAVRFTMLFRRPKEYDIETDTPRDERELWGLKASYLGHKARQKICWQDGVFVVDENAVPAVPRTEIDKTQLAYRVLAGVKRVVANGGHIPADEMVPYSIPWRARREAELRNVPLNTLYEIQAWLLQRAMLVRVRVRGRCLLRPAEGPKYDGEEPWAVFT